MSEPLPPSCAHHGGSEEFGKEFGLPELQLAPTGASIICILEQCTQQNTYKTCILYEQPSLEISGGW